MRSETVRADTRRRHRNATRRDRQGQSRGRDRQLSVLRSAARAQHECGAAGPRCTEARAGQTRGRGDAGTSAASTILKRVTNARARIPAEIVAQARAAYPQPAAQTRIVSEARIRLDPRKSV